jgi:hypothetical protein
VQLLYMMMVPTNRCPVPGTRARYPVSAARYPVPGARCPLPVARTDGNRVQWGPAAAGASKPVAA